LVATVEGDPADKSLGRTVLDGASLKVILSLAKLAGFLDKAEKLFESS
jgi:hypothetical protein